ncbi:unnamed protein product [Didymodactylos carnosus]|uniref:Uncharacterized protein n=1 Tax=Didymodactylos carnosus TaxID=1234261 RepID=A0A813NW87_9BILA|nr:unnamed protein product [Didymodactylos carnosus]CAF3522681.1 unnamed protein product [Didymodactylos carnosus]
MDTNTSTFIDVSPPSSIKSEPPTGTLHNPVYPSDFRDHSPSFLDMLGIPIESDINNSHDGQQNYANDGNEQMFGGYSAPTIPMFINMGYQDNIDDIAFAPTTTNTISRSLASIDVENLPTTTSTIRQRPHYHHFPHHQQFNRYPYVQRAPRMVRQATLPSNLDNLALIEHCPQPRRSYYALRRQRIPVAPPMPKHLYYSGHAHWKAPVPLDDEEEAEVRNKTDHFSRIVIVCLKEMYCQYFSVIL